MTVTQDPAAYLRLLDLADEYETKARISYGKTKMKCWQLAKRYREMAATEMRAKPLPDNQEPRKGRA